MKPNRKNIKGKQPEKGKANKRNDFADTSQQYPLLFACFVITLIAYIPAFTNGWTDWDDNAYVFQNNLTTGLSLSTFPNFFTTYQVGNYHPLAMLSLALDYRLAGMNATWFHFHAIFLHLINITLVFFFVLQLTKKQWAAFITALLFGIHPMHVESVAWISERKDLLYVLYYLAGLIAYLKYVKTKKPMLLGLTFLFFILSLLSKGQAVTFPVVLLLIDYYLSATLKSKMFIEKIPFFLLSLVFGIVAVLAQQSDKAMGLTGVGNYTFINHLLFSAYALLTYFYRALLPLQLSAYYPYPLIVEVKIGWILLVLAATITLFSLVIYSMKRGRTIAFGFGFFLINSILILQLFPVGGAIMADRYTYLSYVGLFFIIGIAVQWLMDNKTSSWAKFKTPVIGLLIVCAVFFSIKTFSRNKVWKGSESLYLDMLNNQAEIPVFNYSLGLEYKKQGKIDLALKYLTRAIQMEPDYREALDSRFNIYWQTKNLDSAIADCNRLIQLSKNDPQPYANRGVAYCVSGKYDAAMQDFNRAISIDPKNVKTYGNRGNLYSMKQMYDSSIADYTEALQYDPTDTIVYVNCGRSYLMKGMPDEAIKFLTIAVKYNPDNGESYSLLADANKAKGNYREALNNALTAQSKGKQIDAAYIEQLRANIPPK